MTEEDKTKAISLMADAMEKGAHYYGPNASQISGDKHILAEHALKGLLQEFNITLPGVEK